MKFADLRLEPVGSSPDELAAAIKSEGARWARVISDYGIKPK